MYLLRIKKKRISSKILIGFSWAIFFLICYALNKLNENYFYSNKQPFFCDPFVKNRNQFSVYIDGHSYPQYMPLSRNQTINFKCLNKAKKLKVILLWNQFFTQDDYFFGLGKKEVFIRNR